jgi:two-component system, sensor histidine kinase and response regulator
MILQNFSIRKKLIGITTLISGITLLLASVSFTVTDYLLEREELKEDVQVLTRIIAFNSRAALAFDDPDTAINILKALQQASSIDKATLYSAKGKRFAEYVRPSSNNQTPHQEQLPFSVSPRTQFIDWALLVTEPIILDEELIGTLVVYANLEELEEEVWRTIFLAGSVLVVSLLIAVFLSLWFQRIISHPIESLRKATIEVGKGRFDTAIVGQHEDEIGQLAKAFQKMVWDLAEQREKLEQATRAKSEFLANMSHEIRTPMNAVIGLSELALALKMTPQLNDYLTKISNSSRSLLRIINDILDFSKIEAGKLELENTDFLLRELFEHLSDMLRAQTTKKHIELIVSLSGECHYELYGDPLRLEQVLLNLMGNAIKFTEEGEVEVQVETVEESPGMVTLQFCVRDTGIGMSPQQKTKLFTAFSQADSSTTRRFGGTGLGLSISQRLVEMMGGKIWAESTVDVGSSFFFTIKGC